MSVQAVQSFLSRVAATESLHAPAIEAWARGGMDAVLRLGKAQGFEFTAADVIAVRDMPKLDASPEMIAFGNKLNTAWDNRNELTDDQLELVAGGTGGATTMGPQPNSADRKS